MIRDARMVQENKVCLCARSRPVHVDDWKGLRNISHLLRRELWLDTCRQEASCYQQLESFHSHMFLHIVTLNFKAQ